MDYPANTNQVWAASKLERLSRLLDTSYGDISNARTASAYTHAYARTLIAIGLCKIGNVERAYELLPGEDEKGSSRIDDPIHKVLIALFDERLRLAASRTWRVTPISKRILKSIARLPRVERYKVDTLRQYSPTLGARVSQSTRLLRFQGRQSRRRSQGEFLHVNQTSQSCCCLWVM